jgi:hypothetical protein
MATSPLMRLSRSLYAALMHFYPERHRIDFGVPMEQLFSDQCREAYRHSGSLGILAVWLSTFPDLCRTAIQEHWSVPNSRMDLIAPDPNQRLPWKSTALILIPGAFLFACQIGGLFGSDWYFNLFQRVGYFLMIPVVAVWWRARKYPVWGLVPLGMSVFGISRVFPTAFFIRLYSLANRLPANPLESLLPYASQIAFTLAALFFTASFLVAIWLFFLHARRFKLSRRAKISVLAIGVLLIAYWSYTLYGLWWLYTDPVAGLLQPGSAIDLPFFSLLFTNWVDNIFSDTTIWLILLAALGTRFSRSFGKLAVLIPLGFLLPTIIFGITGSGAISDPGMLGIIPVVLFWRLLIAIVSPLLLLRALSPQEQSWIALPPVALALLMRLLLTASMNWGPILVDLPANLFVGSFSLANDIFPKFIFPFLVVAVALATYPAERKRSLSPGPVGDRSMAKE